MSVWLSVAILIAVWLLIRGWRDVRRRAARRWRNGRRIAAHPLRSYIQYRCRVYLRRTGPTGRRSTRR